MGVGGLTQSCVSTMPKTQSTEGGGQGIIIFLNKCLKRNSGKAVSLETLNCVRLGSFFSLALRALKALETPLISLLFHCVLIYLGNWGFQGLFSPPSRYLHDFPPKSPHHDLSSIPHCLVLSRLSEGHSLDREGQCEMPFSAMVIQVTALMSQSHNDTYSAPCIQPALGDSACQALCQAF